MVLAITRPFARMFSQKPLAISPTIRWELANKIANQAETPEEIVTALFSTFLADFERAQRKPCSPLFKKTAWNQLGPSCIQLVRENLRENFIEKVLSQLTHEETEQAFGLMEGKHSDDRAWRRLVLYSLYSKDSLNASMLETAVSCKSKWEERLNQNPHIKTG